MKRSHTQALVSPLQFVLTENAAPLYMQLMQHITQLIAQNCLKPEQRMPSSRILSERLNVSRSTVVDVYDRLVAEDILYSIPKKGIFVAQKSLLQSVLTTGKSISTAHLPQSSVQRERLLRFDSGADPDAFPKKAWLKSLRLSWVSPDPLVLKDDYLTGFPLLKATLASYLLELRGLHCTPDQIIITAGNLDALTLIHHLLKKISPDSEWSIENPGYPAIQAFIQSRQRKVHYLSVDDAGCCLPSQNDQAPPVVLMTPNRQYPLGMNLESTRRQAWLNLLTQQRCWIVEDDYDNEFNYQRRDGLPLMQSDQSGRTFFVGSFSKTLFRGLRLGYIVAPPSLVPALVQSRQSLGNSASLPMQPVVAEFMMNGEFARHINRMRRHYRYKRDYLIQLFETHLGDWFSWQKPKGGMHAILMMKSTLNLTNAGTDIYRDQYLADQLLARHIQLSPLSAFYIQNQADQGNVKEGFVCGFTAISEQHMQQIVEAIKATIQSCFNTLSKTGT